MLNSIQAHAKNILPKVLSGRNKLHFTINATAALNTPTVHETIYCQAVTANLDHS